MNTENIFDKFDQLEEVPTSLMQDITEKPAEVKQPGSLQNLTDHTKATSFTEPLQNPGNSQANNPVQALPGTGTQKLNAGNLITGDMATGFLDMLLPVIIILIVDKVAGKKINKRYLQATPEEKKTIAPVLQNYLNSINFNIDNPLNALLLTCAMIYGTKTIEVLNMPDALPAQPMPSAFNKMHQPGRQMPTGNSKYNKDGSPKKDGRGRPRKN